jgi:hypothetical protein
MGWKRAGLLRKRRHSRPGYISPEEFEEKALKETKTISQPLPA